MVEAVNQIQHAGRYRLTKCNILGVLCALCGSLCGSVFAQSPPIAQIEVTAAQNYVVSGRFLQLQARAYSAAGSTINNFSAQWRSANPEIAEINSTGMVRGRLPGTTSIEAIAAGVSGRLSLRIFPGHIEVKPDRLDLQIYRSAAITARALDADGNPLSSRFIWFSGIPAVATVDAAGLVTARGEGSTTITARLDLPEAPFNFAATAIVNVRRPGSFELSRLISNELQNQPVVLRDITDVSLSSKDHLAFTGILSNGSQGAFLWEKGNLRTLAIAGEYQEALGQIIVNFGPVSVNARGEVLVTALLPVWPNQALLLYRPGSAAPENVTIAGDYGGLGIGPRSLSDRGEIVFQTWNSQGNYVLLRGEDGRIKTVISAGQSLPDFGAVEWLGPPSLTPSGRVIFPVGAPNKNGYYLWDGKENRRIYITGQTLGGRVIGWGGEPMEAAGGDLFVQLNVDGSNQIVRYSAGILTAAVSDGQAFPGVVIGNLWSLYDVRGGALLFGAGTDQGGRLLRLEQGFVDTAARFGSAAELNEWTQINQAFIASDGSVIVRGYQGKTPSKVSRLSGSFSERLLQSGTSLNIAASTSLFWANLSGGGDVGNLTFLGPGGPVRVGKSSVQLGAGPGDPLPGGNILTRVNNAGANRNGDFAMAVDTLNGQSLYLLKNGRLSVVAESNGTIKTAGGNTVNGFCCGPVALNNRGQIASFVNFDQGSGMALITPNESVVKVVFTWGSPAPGGSTYNWVQNLALDESGRILFAANLQDGSNAIFLWDNGTTRRLVKIGDSLAGKKINNYASLQAAGKKFYVLFNYENWGNEILQYDGVAWRSLLSSGSLLSTGQNLNYFRYNQFAVSTAGEIVFISDLGPNYAVYLHKADGRDLVVARSGERSSDGEWYFDFLSVTVNEQGIVFFSAISNGRNTDRLSLFQAKSTERSRLRP
jgi:hypothetical protein